MIWGWHISRNSLWPLGLDAGLVTQDKDLDCLREVRHMSCPNDATYDTVLHSYYFVRKAQIEHLLYWEVLPIGGLALGCQLQGVGGLRKPIHARLTSTETILLYPMHDIYLARACNSNNTFNWSVVLNSLQYSRELLLI